MYGKWEKQKRMKSEIRIPKRRAGRRGVLRAEDLAESGGEVGVEEPVAGLSEGGGDEPFAQEHGIGHFAQRRAEQERRSGGPDRAMERFPEGVHELGHRYAF